MLAVVACVAIAAVIAGIVVWATTRSTAPPSTTVTAEEFRQSLPPYSIESLQDTSSPQYRAFEWVTEIDRILRNDTPKDKETTLFRMTQRFALATMLYSINGAGQVQPTVSECEWSNVTCAADSRVDSLDLGGNGGTIPREIGLLTALDRLSLYRNQLTSTIPTELGLLVDLKFLNIARNFLTSAIPTELGKLTKLTVFALAHNQLDSTIPTELGMLTGLTELAVFENVLTSTLPTELGLLTELTGIALYSNGLRSTIPTELGRLSNIRWLYLHQNQLTSTVPTELGRLSLLMDLWLYGNQLSGSLPSAMCQFRNYRPPSPWVDCAEVSCTCCPDCNR
jgi:Leucine-rich repeat (LRR) protein